MYAVVIYAPLYLQKRLGLGTVGNGIIGDASVVYPKITGLKPRYLWRSVLKFK